jgi:phage major head subunit gpT-like protein
MAISTGVTNYGKLLEPGLRKIIFETYNEKPEQFSKVFNVVSSKKAIETDARMGGFSLFNEKATLDSTEYEDLTSLDTVQYKHVTYAKGFIVEKELVDDEQYGQIRKAAQALARAARSTVEVKAATVLNNAFTTSTENWKGEALVSATHSLLGGGTSSNYLGALALDEGNLELAFKLAREQVDERGLKIQMNPNLLIVPPGLEFTAEKLAKSIQLPGSPNNDINPLRGRFQIVVLDYLTDANNWFLADTSMMPLNFFWREKMSFKSENDFDTDAAKYKARMRFSYGWTDWRGIIGSQPNG